MRPRQARAEQKRPDAAAVEAGAGACPGGSCTRARTRADARARARPRPRTISFLRWMAVRMLTIERASSVLATTAMPTSWDDTAELLRCADAICGIRGKPREISVKGWAVNSLDAPKKTLFFFTKVGAPNSGDTSVVWRRRRRERGHGQRGAAPLTAPQPGRSLRSSAA